MAVHTYLDCSTAHIMKEEGVALQYAPVIAVEYEFGAWVHVPDDLDEYDWTSWESLRRVIEYAQQRGCWWVKLDADGETIDGLPTYNWE